MIIKTILFVAIAFLTIMQEDNCTQKESIFVYFEENKDKGMIKYGTSFLYRLSKRSSFCYGFEPYEKPDTINKDLFMKDHKNELQNIDWLVDLSKEYPDSLSRETNVVIVEDIGNDVLKLTKTKHFESIE